MKDLQIPTLTTERLRLEPLGHEHAKGMYDLWSDAAVCKYSGVVTDYDKNIIETPVKDISQSDLIIDFWNKAANDGWGLRWAIILESENEFTGTVGFNSCADYFEIAFHLLPAYWGQGISTEAAKAAMNWAQDNGALGIEAFIEPANEASIALAERLNLKATGQFSEGAQRYQLSFKT